MGALMRTVIVCGIGAAATLGVAADASAQCGGSRATLKPAALQSSSDGWRKRRFEFIAEHDSDQRASIVGLWKVTLMSGSAVIDVGFDMWHADGTEILNDSSPLSNHVCLGVWKQTGPREFLLSHPALRFAADGSLIGTLVLRETNVVNRAGDRFTGTFTIEFFDLANNSVFTGAGDIVGERYTVE